ncbi:hypothetical protein BLA6993_07027 [Burkholderia lata]|uniref:hypothetical protein n=1 Tax=Burkholderia lata (strain ATCC 17760 / DSM 23089 / LMG 22485 / NCIMB 9086 / R18194 / 383) TaxID=482957 RepID=UPI0014538EFE|nr:hypothetical protein [Burkholderia lata]VWC40595.1 hypothetical protein BLA6993_07027 [Burkholderia lata]
MIGEIVPATVEHAIAMAPRAREVEVRELRDSAGLSVLDVLIGELARSASAWSWVVDGEVACMFGLVTPTRISGNAFPWFLSSHLVDRHAHAFARASRLLLPELLERHPRLIGMVDARYALSVRWLTWLGARIGEPEPWGVVGAPFRKFEIGE